MTVDLLTEGKVNDEKTFTLVAAAWVSVDRHQPGPVAVNGGELSTDTERCLDGPRGGE